MTIDDGQVRRSRLGLCEFPGVECPNTKPADPGKSGRPPKYCGQEGPGPDGHLVVHNKANAYAANRYLKQALDASDRPAAIPVPLLGQSSTARLTLEQQMLGLPGQLAQLQTFLTEIAENIRRYGDAEAVAGEIEQLKAAHRAELAEVERQRGEEEHRRRLAEQKAADAEDARDEAAEAADQALADLEAARAEAAAAVEAAEQARREAEDERAAAISETEQVRAEVQQVRAEAEQQIHELQAAADRRVHEARAEAAQQVREVHAAADRQVHEARAEAETARITAATAEADLRTAQEAAERLTDELRQERDRHRAEVEQLRADHRSDREQLRADHQTQLADIRKAAAEQVAALTTAQRAAERLAEDARSQLAKLTEQLDRATTTESPAGQRAGAR